MKKILLTVIILITAFSFSNLNAQVKGGFKMGVDFSNFKDSDAKNLISPRMGFLIEVGINENLFVQTGIYASLKGFRYDGVRYENNKAVDSKEYQFMICTNLPINFGYKYDLGGAKLFAMAGPEISYNSYATLLYKADGTWDNDHQTIGNESFNNFKPLNFSANIEGGIEVNRFQFSAFYTLGLSNIDASGWFDFKTRVFGLTTAVKFGKVDNKKHRRYRRR